MIRLFLFSIFVGLVVFSTPAQGINTASQLNPPDSSDRDFNWHQTLGEQRLAVILVHEPGQNTLGKTKEEVWHEIFDLGNPDSYNNFLREQSYGKTWLSGDVYGWYVVADTQSPADAVGAADPDVDFSTVDRLWWIHPNPGSSVVDCFAGGGGGSPSLFDTGEGTQGLVLVHIAFDENCLASRGLPLDFSRRRYNQGLDSYHHISHEMGHSFFLPHARRLNCGAVPYTADGIGCTVSGHTVLDQVGVGKGHHNAMNKEFMKWFSETNVLEVMQSGVYSIRPLEVTTNQVQLLKVPRNECANTFNLGDSCGGDERGWYYLEFRRPIGHDRGLFANGLYNHDGAAIHIDAFRGQSQPVDAGSLLLDMVAGNFFRYTLEEGASFVDPHRGTVIRTRSVGPNLLEVEVTLANGVCGDGVVQAGYQEECDDGNTNSQDSCTNGCKAARCGDNLCQSGVEESVCPLDCSKRVFVVSYPFHGNFGGVRAADEICQSFGNGMLFTAEPGTLEGNWKAWISNGTRSAASRLVHSMTPYRLLTGATIADDWNDLADGSLDHPINVNQQGNTVSSGMVWTGTNTDGSIGTARCGGNWGSNTERATTGLLTSSTAAWTAAGSISMCSVPGTLYCFEQ